MGHRGEVGDRILADRGNLRPFPVSDVAPERVLRPEPGAESGTARAVLTPRAGHALGRLPCLSLRPLLYCAHVVGSSELAVGAA